MKTPGVYIVEKDAFPNAVVTVPTAVPAFIGYTQLTMRGDKSIKHEPFRISSMLEFETIFGLRHVTKFDVIETPSQEHADIVVADQYYDLRRVGQHYLLHQAMHMFYQNGGGDCYVVCAGSYADAIHKDDFLICMQALLKEQEPTLLVIPEAVSLSQAECYEVQQQMLLQCGVVSRSCFAILDVYNGFQSDNDAIAAFRQNLSTQEGGGFAAAYYPWINTTVVSQHDVSYVNLSVSGKQMMQTILRGALPDTHTHAELLALINAINEEFDVSIDNALRISSPHYVAVIDAIKWHLNNLPPSSAIAGVYALVDAHSGVWQAPANVGLSAVTAPAVNITHDEQQHFNIAVDGKSVNAIRAFPGEGVLLWGARTLDGNSLDWRYINVRRTMMMLEQSISYAAKAFVFERNEAATWLTIKSMVQHFLTGIWKQGGLAGATPEDAFSVHCGLGNTMTAEDIIDGRLRLTVLVAVTRPAEFIEITVEQAMQSA
jgi:phage tail sheath protein FI